MSIEMAAAASSRQGATIPNQQVASDGTITVPYAGQVPAAGRMPAEVQQTIEVLLASKALEPQALVIVKKTAANAVTVAGETVGGARVALSPAGTGCFRSSPLPAGPRHRSTTALSGCRATA